MALKPAQKTKLLAAIAADPLLAAFPNTNDGAFEIAQLLNIEASPAFVVWRTDYNASQIRDAITSAATQLDNLTASKRQSLLWWAEGTYDMGKVAARAAITDFTNGFATLQNSLLDGGKRAALRIEAVLANGTGTLANPGKLTWEGQISYQDVFDARSS
jgi:hypothetical protein